MKLKFRQVIYGVGLSVILAACGGGGDEEGGEDPAIDPGDTGETGTTIGDGPVNTQVGEYMFSVPSPIQMAEIIKNSDATFNGELVNEHENVSHYSTSFQKALNLGVYGADLGYLTMYGITEDALSYLTAIQKLTDDLSISGAFDEALLNRFADNIGKEDSMQVMVAEAYRAGNNYLQEEERFDIVGLLLTGGFIESLYFACDVAQATGGQEILNAVGNQKSSLTNLRKMLTQVNKDVQDDLMQDLIDRLTALENKFSNINISYTYNKPKTVAEKKITYITSSTDVKISSEELNEITTLVGDIRSMIIEN